MESRASDSQKKNSQIKLPAINQRKGGSSRVLSNTLPDNCKSRPSSVHKVQDLQKKLFDKLESYENPSKKAMKRSTKKRIEGENALQPQIEGFQRMQKLMPGLFNKLIEVKKNINIDLASSKQVESLASQSKIGNQNFIADHKRRKTQTNQNSVQKDQKQLNNQLEMTRQELDLFYTDYSRRQQLGPETSGAQLAAMGQSLLVCEKEIEKLTKSMEGLIRQLGHQCIIDYQIEEEINLM